MYSQTIKFWPVVIKQFLFKWNANKDMFTGLAILQLVALFFSSNGSGSFSHGSGVDVYMYTSDIIVVFTMIWLLVISVQILRPLNGLTTYTMVANRKVDHTSNMMWIIVMSVIGAGTVLLANVLLQLIMNYLPGGVPLMPEVSITFLNYVIGALTTFIYLVFAGAIGYFFGVIGQWNHLVRVITPLLLIGALLIAPAILPEDLFMKAFSFIFLEKTFFVFVLKMLVMITLLFIASLGIGNRLEVRK